MILGSLISDWQRQHLEPLKTLRKCSFKMNKERILLWLTLLLLWQVISLAPGQKLFLQVLQFQLLLQALSLQVPGGLLPLKNQAEVDVVPSMQLPQLKFHAVSQCYVRTLIKCS